MPRTSTARAIAIRLSAPDNARFMEAYRATLSTGIGWSISTMACALIVYGLQHASAYAAGTVAAAPRDERLKFYMDNVLEARVQAFGAKHGLLTQTAAYELLMLGLAHRPLTFLQEVVTTTVSP